MNILYDLLEILSELESTKSDVHYSQLLSYFDTSPGSILLSTNYPTVFKKNGQLAPQPTRNSIKYHLFIDFIRDMSEMKNDPAFVYDNSRVTPSSTPVRGNRRESILDRKTYVQQETMKRCPIHKAEHSL